ncbi:MAG: hypothetical protein RL226_9 [Bacteroidota bacterium]
MKGILSKSSITGKGVQFARLMSVIAALSTVVFGVVLYAVVGGVELIWDRALVFVFVLITFLLSYSNSKQAVLYRMMNAMFYIYTAQVILSIWLNHFGFYYIMSLFLTLQAVTISFKRTTQAFFYLLFFNVGTTLAVMACENEYLSTATYTMLAILISSALLYALVKVKSGFQQDVKVQKDLLMSIVAKTEEAILLTDFEGIIQDANSAAADMFGYDHSSLFGKDVSDFRLRRLTPEEDFNGVSTLLKDHFWNDEVIMKRSDGSTFPTFLSISWIHRNSEELLVYRVRDITEEKNKTSELVVAKEAAEKAVKVKADFLATMSHEIRTPMNGVLGMVELLSETPLTRDQRTFVDTIRMSGQNLLVIINDILDFSKIESGKLEMKKVPIDIRKMMEEVFRLMSVTAKEKGLRMFLHVDDEIRLRALGDEVRIKQVLINLAGNAIKFTESGNIVLSAKLKGDGNNQYTIVFSIADTGIGIEPEKVSMLFESFTQIDSSSSRKYGGTGLGLAISKRLIELMDGSIRVDSIPGKGSTFSFELALPCTEEKAGNDLRSEERKFTSEEMFDISNLSICVAEDNIINQHVIRLLLADFGIHPTVVSNGAELIEELKTNRYDAVFMDLQMPEIDGFEAAELIRDMNFNDHSPPQIIAVSANVLEEEKKLCKSLGMIDFLNKPIELDRLYEVLSLLVKLKQDLGIRE